MRPKRIRCWCCGRFMSYLPYNPGDAIRRPAGVAGHCFDCKTGYNREMPKGKTICEARGCEPQNTLDRIALILHRQDHPDIMPGP